MEMPIYTAALAGFLIILQVALQLSVGLYRTKTMKGTGVGDDLVLERLVRRHGNLAENSGLFVAAIALLELLVGQTQTVFYLCVAYAIARMLHAVGFSNQTGSPSPSTADAPYRAASCGLEVT